MKFKSIFFVVSLFIIAPSIFSQENTKYGHTIDFSFTTEELKTINLSSDENVMAKVQVKNYKGNFITCGYFKLKGFGDQDKIDTVGGIDWTNVHGVNIIFMNSNKDYKISLIKDGSDIVIVIEDEDNAISK